MYDHAKSSIHIRSPIVYHYNAIDLLRMRGAYKAELLFPFFVTFFIFKYGTSPSHHFQMEGFSCQEMQQEQFFSYFFF